MLPFPAGRLPAGRAGHLSARNDRFNHISTSFFSSRRWDLAGRSVRRGSSMDRYGGEWASNLMVMLSYLFKSGIDSIGMTIFAKACVTSERIYFFLYLSSRLKVNNDNVNTLHMETVKMNKLGAKWILMKDFPIFLKIFFVPWMKNFVVSRIGLGQLKYPF